jgi:hypothetical protein
MTGCGTCERLRRILPGAMADRLRQLELDRARRREARKAQKRAAQGQVVPRGT